MGGADGPVLLRSGCSCSPAASATSWSRGRCSRSSSCSSRAPCRVFAGGAGRPRAAAERVVLVGRRPARGGARRARDVPGHRRRPGEPRLLRRRVLRRAALDRRAGPGDRAAGAAPRRDVVRAGAPAAAGRGGDDPRARGGGPRAHGPARATRSPGGACATSALPREAVVNVIVRANEAIPPRGSTILRAGDRLHVLLRQETAVEVRGLVDRWTVGPSDRRRARAGRSAARPSSPCGRCARAPWRATSRGRRRSAGHEVVVAAAHPPRRAGRARRARRRPLRRHGPAHRDRQSRESLRGWSERRLRQLDPDDDETAWLQNVNGALATDLARA